MTKIKYCVNYLKKLDKKLYFLPFTLTVLIIIIDQLSKFWVVGHIDLIFERIEIIGDFLGFIHVRNPGMALSLGADLPLIWRRVLLIVLPALVLAILLIGYLRNANFSRLQRWCIAGIIGGGIGNMIDRIAYPEGVVDFIQVNMYGFLGMSAFPTFNVADSSVVVCSFLLVFSILKKKDKPLKTPQVSDDLSNPEPRRNHQK